jgi:3-oxoacyl-[acyl-carrier protein] reductase
MVLITPIGAASGFGLATTLRFVAEGAKVVAADMAEEKLNKEFAGQKDTHVLPVVANVTSAADWKKLVDTAVQKFGGLDILVSGSLRCAHTILTRCQVNNAGTSYRNKPTLEVTEDEFDRVMLVNVKSIYLSVIAAVPALKQRGGGAIINVSPDH